jgi:hypothetical protein
MIEILRNEKAGTRAWVAASKTLVSMTTATAASISAALHAREQIELSARLEALESWQANEASNPEQRPRIQPTRSDYRSDRKEINGGEKPPHETHRGQADQSGRAEKPKEEPPREMEEEDWR